MIFLPFVKQGDNGVTYSVTPYSGLNRALSLSELLGQVQNSETGSRYVKNAGVSPPPQLSRSLDRLSQLFIPGCSVYVSVCALTYVRLESMEVFC